MSVYKIVELYVVDMVKECNVFLPVGYISDCMIYKTGSDDHVLYIGSHVHY